jgi:nitrogen fixation NifU-like protein
MTQDLYQEVILEEYQHPQNYGLLDQPDLVLEERNASCGDQMTVYLHLEPAQSVSSTSRIKDIKWQGQGCAISMAAMSVLSRHILDKKMTLGELQKMEKSELEELLGLDDIATGRVKCLLLGLQAIKRAIPVTTHNN